jgi:hypothetical protein
MGNVPYAEQEENDKYQEGYYTHRHLLLLDILKRASSEQ